MLFKIVGVLSIGRDCRRFLVALRFKNERDGPPEHEGMLYNFYDALRRKRMHYAFDPSFTNLNVHAIWYLFGAFLSPSSDNKRSIKSVSWFIHISAPIVKMVSVLLI